MKKVIVIFSGGPDSTAAAKWAMLQEYDVELLTFKFTDTNLQDGELFAAKEISGKLNLNHTIVDFSSPMHLFSPQSRALMHTGIPKNTKEKNQSHLLTFGSGMVLSTASCYALYNEIDTIIWGATKDDADHNNDYTQNFATSLATIISEVSNSEFNISAPFAEKRKFQVLSVYKDNEDLFA